jgi:hypothetical protein
VVNPFAPENGMVQGVLKKKEMSEDDEGGNNEEMDDKFMLQKKGTGASPSRGAKRKNLFKNN